MSVCVCAMFLMGLMSLDITLSEAAQDHSVFTCIVPGCGFLCTGCGIMYVTHTHTQYIYMFRYVLYYQLTYIQADWITVVQVPLFPLYAPEQEVSLCK